MHVRNMILRVGTALVLSIVLIGEAHSFAVTATTNYQHAATPDVFITEVQSGSATSAGEEFVELYNNTASDIDLSDAAHAGKDAWKLQYFAKTKLPTLIGTSNWTSPFRTISLTGVIVAHDYYVLAGTGYVPGNIDPNQTYTSTLSDEGGAVQLIDTTTTGSVTTVTIHDQLAWSNDTPLAVNPVLYAAPGAGASLQRKPNENSEYVATDNSLTAFLVDTRTSPEAAWTPLPPTANPSDTDPTPPTDDTSSDATDPATDPTVPLPLPPTNDGLLPLTITELLPNPASPQTDAQDEYIELYNPNDTAFNLNGYTLETGETTLHDFTFTTDILVQPHSYRSLYSADTGLSLSNSGGRARLLDGNATLLAQTASYGTAPDGQAWALDETNGTWGWTTTPTPDEANIITAPVVVVKQAAVKTVVQKKAVVAKVKGTTTAKKAKTPSTKKPKKATQTTTSAKLASTTTPQAPAPIHPVMLAAVAGLAVGYGVYEYRHDLANAVYKYRTNRAVRRSARK